MLSAAAAAGTLQEPLFDVAKYRKQYPFTLDSFQTISVACLVRAAALPPCTARRTSQQLLHMRARLRAVTQLALRA